MASASERSGWREFERVNTEVTAVVVGCALVPTGSGPACPRVGAWQSPLTIANGYAFAR
ncbi:MAG: hypothetical protein U0841_33090 [Chloroflexia bacterium]